VSELKSVRRGVKVDADLGDTTRTFELSMSSDTPEESFVTVEKTFGDIWERDLMTITTFEARVFWIPSTKDKKPVSFSLPELRPSLSFIRGGQICLSSLSKTM
jgi:hypothetical protein